MKNYLALFLLFLLTISCDENDGSTEPEIIYPDNERDFITSADFYDTNGQMVFKDIVYHDGSHYTGFSSYEVDELGNYIFIERVALTYNSDGRLVSSEFYDNVQMSGKPSTKYDYEWLANDYKVERLDLIGDEYVATSTRPYIGLVDPPENGFILRFTYNLLGFENGNFMGWGGNIVHSNGGKKVKYQGQEYRFFQYYQYDDYPNIYSEPVFSYMIQGDTSHIGSPENTYHFGGAMLFNYQNRNNQIVNQFNPRLVKTTSYTFGLDKIRKVEGHIESFRGTFGKIEFNYIDETSIIN